MIKVFIRTTCSGFQCYETEYWFIIYFNKFWHSFFFFIYYFIFCRNLIYIISFVENWSIIHSYYVHDCNLYQCVELLSVFVTYLKFQRILLKNKNKIVNFKQIVFTRFESPKTEFLIIYLDISGPYYCLLSDWTLYPRVLWVAPTVYF